MTLQEQNKKSQTRFINEFQENADESVALELIADDFINHAGMPGIPNNREGVIILFRMLRNAFGKMKASIHDMIAEDDKVVTRKSFNGKHIGEFMGIPSTGKDVTINLIDIVRYDNGKIKEHWNVLDRAGLMQQITS